MFADVSSIYADTAAIFAVFASVFADVTSIFADIASIFADIASIFGGRLVSLRHDLLLYAPDATPPSNPFSVATGPTRLPTWVRAGLVLDPISLRAPYGMSGTDALCGTEKRGSMGERGTEVVSAYGRVLCAYALSGTEVACSAAICLCACYVMSSTDTTYGATISYARAMPRP
eukprot:3941460-Rhodomonas_salina.1